MELPQYRYIAVEGPIGVGATSLTAMLANHFKAAEIYEKVDENPFLEKFYRDREKYGFSTQVFFLLSRYRQLKDLDNTSPMVADYMLGKDRIFAELNLNTEELALYDEIYKQLEVNVPQPDLVIVLTAKTNTLIERVKKRGRAFERDIPEKYIEAVNEAYQQFFFRYEEGPVLMVNTNEIDFVENKGDYRKLIEKIASPIRGKEFFNPLGSI